MDEQEEQRVRQGVQNWEAAGQVLARLRAEAIRAIIKSVPNWEQPISKATPLYRAVPKEGILVR